MRNGQSDRATVNLFNTSVIGSSTMIAVPCGVFRAVIYLLAVLPPVASYSTMINWQSVAFRLTRGVCCHRSRSRKLFLSLDAFSLRDIPTLSSLGETGFSSPELPPVEEFSKRLFLVRHGEVINPGGDRSVYYGALDVPLSPLGEEEAKAAGVYLQSFDLEFVVSSPLSRAVYGAKQVLARQKGSKNGSTGASDVIQIDGFKELDRGSWCGKTKEEIGADMMSRFDACDESVTPEGGESYPFLKERVLNARNEVLAKVSAGRSAAIVSHLQVTRCMLSDALDVPTEEMVGLKVATASISCIDYDAKTGTQTVRFQSFKPDTGMEKSKDGAN